MGTPCKKMGYEVGQEFEITGTDPSTAGVVTVGDRCVLVLDDETERPLFVLPTRNIIMYLRLCDVRPYVAGSFDPVPWFCGALLIAYFIVEYIGGGIGV